MVGIQALGASDNRRKWPLRGRGTRGQVCPQIRCISSCKVSNWVNGSQRHVVSSVLCRTSGLVSVTAMMDLLSCTLVPDKRFGEPLPLCWTTSSLTSSVLIRSDEKVAGS